MSAPAGTSITGVMVEDRQQRVPVAEAADRREVVAADCHVVDLHVDREVAHAAADHVVVLRIARVAGAEDERVGRAIRDAEARREEIFLHLDAAIDRDVAEAAEQQTVLREVEQLDAAIGVLRHGIVLPAHARRHRELARQLELIADVDAVLPRPERRRLLVAAVLFVEQRILQGRVARERQTRAGSPRSR